MSDADSKPPDEAPKVPTRSDRPISPSAKRRSEPAASQSQQPINIVDAPPGKRAQVIAQSSVWQAPLPRPEDLKAFGEVNPAFPERIVRMAEEAAQHRRDRETDWQKALIRDARDQRAERRVGQVCAFALSVVFCLAGVYAAGIDKQAFAIALVASSLAPIVVSFVTGRRRDEERAARDEDLLLPDENRGEGNS